MYNKIADKEKKMKENILVVLAVLILATMWCQIANQAQKNRYEVVTAKDGLEGLNKALNNAYDLILLDVMMPKMNGFDVCKNIRQAKLAIPILMLTAKGTIDDKTEGFDCGADV